MKKLLTISLALLFVVVMVGAAFSAETTFEGQYRVRAWAEWNFDKQAGYDPSTGTDHPQYDGWFDQRFRLTITHTRSEFLKAVIRLDLVEDTWGQQRNFRINNSINGSYIDWAYLEFTLPKIGTFTVGKFPQTFGYGLVFSAVSPGVDGVKWANTWGPVTASAMYLKWNDNVTLGGTSRYYNRDANIWAADLQIAPNDKHNIELFAIVLASDTTLTPTWASFIYGARVHGSADGNVTATGFGVAYTGNFADMIDVKAEYSWVLGSLDWNGRSALPAGYDDHVALEGWNLYLDASYYNDLLRVGLAFVMGSGEKHYWGPTSVHKINTSWLIEEDFAFANIIGNGYGGTNSIWVAPGFGDNVENLTAVKLYFEITPIEKLTLNAAVIWARWTDPVGSGALTGNDFAYYPHPASWYSKYGITPWKASADLGWEIDFGFSYEIMEGLTYSFGAGVLFTGDSFDYATAAGTREDWGPIWSINNVLLYEF